MCDLTQVPDNCFRMTLGEQRWLRRLHRKTARDIRDVKVFHGHMHAWVIGMGWIRTTDLLAKS